MGTVSETFSKVQRCFFGPIEVAFGRRFSAAHRKLVEQEYGSLDERSFRLAAAALMAGSVPSTAQCYYALDEQERASLSLRSALKPSDIYYSLGKTNAYLIFRWEPFWDLWIDVFRSIGMQVQLIKMDGGDTMTVPCRDPSEFKGHCIRAGFVLT